MKALAWIIVLFAAAVGITLLNHNLHGDVFIVTGSPADRVETHLSLNVLIIGILLLWLIVYILFRIVDTILNIPGGLRNWSTQRGLSRASSDLNEAGLAYFEGRYQRAQQLAQRLLKNKRAEDKYPLALILAAHSADAIGDVSNRAMYLEKLGHLPEKSQLARYLMLAETALGNGQIALAEENLQSAREISPHLTQLIKLDLRCALERNNTEDILKNINLLRKNNAISEKEVETYQKLAFRQLLQKSTNTTVQQTIKSIPKELRYGVLSVDIAQCYHQLGLYQETVAWVKKYYPKSHNDGLLAVLVEVYPYLEQKEQMKIFSQVEGWLKEQSQNPILLQSLGQMACAGQLWGKAQNYLDAALSIDPSSVASHLTMAKVLADTGKTTASEAHNKKALELIAEHSSHEDLAEETEAKSEA